MTNVVRERSRRAGRARAVRAAAPGAAVRLLPAARRRRLQDQARDPALRRPGVDHRAGRRRAAHGYDLVLKEHPMSIGRNRLSLLRRLARTRTSASSRRTRRSHELIRGAEAVAVISSTVGLEALLYGKPVLTLGQPFYSGYGVTLDVDSFARDPHGGSRAAALHARPRAHAAVPARGDARVLPGQAGARRPLGRERGELAGSLDAAAAGMRRRRWSRPPRPRPGAPARRRGEGAAPDPRGHDPGVSGLRGEGAAPDPRGHDPGVSRLRGEGAAPDPRGHDPGVSRLRVGLAIRKRAEGQT